VSNGDLTEALKLTLRKEIVLALEDGHCGLTGQSLIGAVQFSQQELILSCILGGEGVALVRLNAYLAATAELSNEPCQL
jgi:hypothetical protein